MGLINNAIEGIQSHIVKKRAIKAIRTLDPALQIAALNNLMDSAGLNDKHKKEVKVELGNKLMEIIRGLR